MTDEFKLSDDYWDCECVHDYIHPNTEDVCDKCKALREDQPDSRLDEIEKYITKAKTND